MSAPRAHPRSPFAGRERELERLRSAAHDVAESLKRIVVVRADAGMGKTALLERFSADLEGYNVCLVRGERHRREALGPITSALRRLLRSRSEADAAALAGHTESSEIEFHALLSIFEGLAVDHPTAIIFDDIQDLDATSCDLAFELMQLDVPLLIVVSARLHCEPRTEALIADILRLPDASEIVLQPLSIDELSALAPGSRREAVAAAHQRSGGNTLFAKLLIEQGLDARVPSTLEAAAAERITPLSGAEKAIVRALALAPMPLDVSLLHAVVPEGDAQTVQRLQQASLIVERGHGYALVHAYIGDAVIESMTPAERIAVQQRLLDALESGGHGEHLSASLAGLARATGDRERWIAHALAAVQESLAVREDAEAIARIEEALEALPADDRRRFSLLRSLFSVAMRVDRDLVPRCLERIDKDPGVRHDSRVHTLSMLAQSRLELVATRPIAAIEAARAELPRCTDSILRAQLLTTIAEACNAAGRADEGVEAAAEAVQLFETHAPDDREHGFALRRLAEGQLALSDHAGVSQTIVRLEHFAELVSSEMERARTINAIGVAMNGWHKVGDVFAQHKRAYFAAKRVGNDDYAFLIGTNDAFRDLQEGRWRHLFILEEDLKRGTPRSDALMNEAHFHRLRSAIAIGHVFSGDLEAARTRLGALHISESPGVTLPRATAFAATALCFDEAEISVLRAEARHDLLSLKKTHAPMMIVRLFFALLYAALVDAVDFGDLDRFAERSATVPLFNAEVLAARALLTLRAGRAAEALLLARGADETFNRLDMYGFSTVLWTALTSQSPEATKREHGHTRAIEHARREQMHGLERRLAGTTRSTSAPQPKAAPTLTRRERDVAALVCEGSTNREIASALFLSERTVEAHIRNMLNRLNLNSRAQIAAYAVREGLAS